MCTHPLIAILIFIIALGCSSTSNASTPRHQLLTALLSKYVQDGVVNYKELRSDKRLSQYINWLATTDPQTLSDANDRLAFWINAYNAYTLKVICDNYPVKSIMDIRGPAGDAKTSVWDLDLATINSKAMSLNHIEHEIIRPKFKDPRAHFALVCASKSCPALRSDAFEGETLDGQLKEQGRRFLTDTSRNEFNPVRIEARLSQVFEWFRDDFGSSKNERLQFLAQFLPDTLAGKIRASPERWTISYKTYDWSLNGF